MPDARIAEIGLTGSFEHEAWNKADQPRAVLLVDLWHPELTALEIDVLNHFAADLASLRSRLDEGRDVVGDASG